VSNTAQGNAQETQQPIPAAHTHGDAHLSWLNPTRPLKQEPVVAEPPLPSSSVIVESTCCSDMLPSVSTRHATNAQHRISPPRGRSLAQTENLQALARALALRSVS